MDANTDETQTYAARRKVEERRETQTESRNLQSRHVSRLNGRSVSRMKPVNQTRFYIKQSPKTLHSSHSSQLSVGMNNTLVSERQSISVLIRPSLGATVLIIILKIHSTNIHERVSGDVRLQYIRV